MADLMIAAEAIPFVPGIHFGYPEDRYHQISALGSTSLKELVLDPVEYQHQRLHGGEKRETFALKWGSAIHCRALEGRESLKERFPVGPALADYPKALVTVDHVRSHCKLLGVKADGTKKEDYIRAIRTFDDDVVIWDEVLAKFEAESVGKTIIPRDALEHIERAAQWMQRDRYLGPVMEDGTFTAGASEVSIFYEDNGVRLKARLDHLLSHAVVDLKSFRPFFAEPVRPAAMKAVARMRYDLQAAAYVRALKAAAKLYAEGKVFNCPYDPEFLASVFAALKVAEATPRHNDALKWIWVLIKASGAPQPIVAEFDLSSMIFKTATMQIEDAIKNYRRNIERFGLDQDWVPENPSEIWGDTDFPAYLFQ
jgi:hypothetical protein